MFNLSDPGRTDYDLNLQVGPFPIRIHPLFWIMAAVLGAMNSNSQDGIILIMIAIWVVVIFCSILVHELGHAIAMRYYGETARIVLYMMGGLAISGEEGWFAARSQRPRTTVQQVIISAAGPAAGFILAALIAAIVFAAGGTVDIQLYNNFIPIPRFELLRGEPLYETVAAQPSSIYLIEVIHASLFINIFWGIFNLLPVFPLDGGQITRAIILHYDPWQGVKKSLFVSLGASCIIAVFGFTQGQSFIGIMFAMFAISSWQSIQQIDGRGGFGGPRW